MARVTRRRNRLRLCGTRFPCKRLVNGGAGAHLGKRLLGACKSQLFQAICCPFSAFNSPLTSDETEMLEGVRGKSQKRLLIRIIYIF